MPLLPSSHFDVIQRQWASVWWCSLCLCLRYFITSTPPCLREAGGDPFWLLMIIVWMIRAKSDYWVSKCQQWVIMHILSHFIFSLLLWNKDYYYPFLQMKKDTERLNNWPNIIQLLKQGSWIQIWATWTWILILNLFLTMIWLSKWSPRKEEGETEGKDCGYKMQSYTNLGFSRAYTKIKYLGSNSDMIGSPRLAQRWLGKNSKC